MNRCRGYVGVGGGTFWKKDAYCPIILRYEYSLKLNCYDVYGEGLYGADGDGPWRRDPRVVSGCTPRGPAVQPGVDSIHLLYGEGYCP